jgi:uncharacterized protein YigE (DUF2233 family)|tara:strand:+ start:19894 stop:20628 length:735 start_codon:yes stop_codon:yes gene_type:complete
MILRAALAWMVMFGVAQAATCEDVTYADNAYSICTVDMNTETLRLFLNDDAGVPYGHFGILNNALQGSGETLGFAMNAGMYHEDRSPVGHHIEDGVEIMRVIPNAGPGNFGLLPNGVLCLQDKQANVIETLRYLVKKPACTYATQSGPMLVIDGELHPRFLATGTSRYIRNAVGTTADGITAVFAISNDIVTFHEFGSFFRDHLKLPQALFMDGNVSRLYAPQIGRNDIGRRLGPIIGTVVPEN